MTAPSSASPHRLFRPRRLVPFAATAAALAVALAACGSSGPTPTPTPPPDPKVVVENSATSLATLKSFHLEVALSGTLQVPGSDASSSPTPVTLDGTKFTADLDLGNQKANMALVIPPALLATALAASGVPLPTTGASGDTADVLYDGTDLYVKVPLAASMLGSDKWIKISQATVQNMFQQYSAGFNAAAPSAGPIASPDLAAINAFLAASGITVTSQGTDSCADGTCNKTVITVPASAIQALMAQAAASNSALGSSAPDLSSLGALGDQSVTIWTATSNDRFNKLALTLNAGTAGSATLTITLSNFDQPITVTTPSPDQVTSFPGL